MRVGEMGVTKGSGMNPSYVH